MKILCPLLVVIALSSCSLKKNLDEMHNSTVNADKNTSHLVGSTDEVKDETIGMVVALKQGDSSQLRDKALKDLIDAKSLAAKTLYASKWLYAFEFQIWKNSKIEGVDPIELRETLKKEAIIEFLKKMFDFVPSKSKIKITATSSDNTQLSLYAIVATLHKINPYQKILLGTHTDMKEISMLDLIEETLEKADLVKTGRIARDDLSPDEKELLNEEQLFRYLLKLRYKVLPVIALGRISNIQDGLFTKIKMLILDWTPKFDANLEPFDSEESANVQKMGDLNLVQIHYAGEIFEEAYKCAKYLYSIGEMPSLDKKVLKIYRHMNLEPLYTALKDEEGKIDSDAKAHYDAIKFFEEQARNVLDLN